MVKGLPQHDHILFFHGSIFVTVHVPPLCSGNKEFLFWKEKAICTFFRNRWWIWLRQRIKAEKQKIYESCFRKLNLYPCIGSTISRGYLESLFFPKTSKTSFLVFKLPFNLRGVILWIQSKLHEGHYHLKKKVCRFQLISVKKPQNTIRWF